jgi:hypothetical protein
MQTSIEWFYDQITRTYWDYMTTERQNELFEQAKEMHKQEIINSVLFGMQKGLNINKVPETDNDWVNNYYQNTFKKD